MIEKCTDEVLTVVIDRPDLLSLLAIDKDYTTISAYVSPTGTLEVKFRKTKSQMVTEE